MTTAPLAAAPQAAPDPHAAVAEVAAVAERHSRRTDAEAAFPVEVLGELRRTGLLGLLVPGRFGGMGGGLREMIEAAEQLGRVDMSVAMIFAMHCQQVAAITEHAGEDLAAQVLPRIAAGQLYLGSITTELATGGHLLTSEAKLGAEDGRLQLDRFAPIVTGGAYADAFLITMQSPFARGSHEVSLVLAEAAELDLQVSGNWNPLGMRASHSVALKLRGSVAADRVIGGHGGFRQVATQTFGPMAHLGWSACWLGTAAGALSRVLSLIREPANRSKYPTDSPLLLRRLSEARCRLDTVHALLQHTRSVVEESLDRSSPRIQLLLNALKIQASEQCLGVVDSLMDIVGMRHAYLADSPTRLEFALRDLRSAPLNYSNDRLHEVDGKFTLLDQAVRFV
ncbi:MAG TPA: acyl-CoA dehydrogenase family protein [Jatrophihabitans sp.]|jgi:alkylation response protein AidB-like acyl-CoA dehydrogenase|uniref:acyl-CoA dehydrogenase family protein n=1 Tax=Jatrophihabitans sp. TaxID=1932789 RepID=UPI002F05D66E